MSHLTPVAVLLKTECMNTVDVIRKFVSYPYIEVSRSGIKHVTITSNTSIETNCRQHAELVGLHKRY